ncbi:MAG: hypothetical protein V1861_02280, partial [Candidatus Micrarchaeota archaeon]
GQAAVERTPFSARRGQAAVEYLMTYGWVVLALVIVIGVLFSTGIFSPSYMVTEECNFGNNLKCSATLFNEGGDTKIILNVFNGFPYKVKVTEVALATQDGKQQFIGFDTDINISSGENVSFRADLTPALPEGTSKRFVGNLTYVSCAPELGTGCSSVEHLSSGRITSTVISAD